jgi:hypothetical protein
VGSAIRVHGESANLIASVVKRLAKKFGPAEFSSQDAAASLNLPKRTATRRLQEALAGGRLIKLSDGRKTRYKVAA